MHYQTLNKRQYSSKSRLLAGFTIVELVVVISLIGILASVGVLSYNNWQQSVTITTLKSDLNGAASSMENARNFGNAYPASVPSNFTASKDVVVSGGATNGGKSYCINIVSTTSPSISYHLDSSDTSQGAQAGLCYSFTGQTLSYTGNYQNFTVPSGMATLTMEVWGAQGGGSSGGLGGYSKATVAVTSGETLRVYVGGQGATGTCSNTAFCATGGFNGGGNASSSDITSTQYGGGGASDIRRSPYTLSDRLVVAGGGGSKGGIYTTWHPGSGGAGGQTGQSGTACPDCTDYLVTLGGPGGGATQSSGGGVGAGGSWIVGGTTYPGWTGNVGSLGQGANGVGCWFTGSGAGGGGYYGGGSAGCPGSHGGGGGSSWATPLSTNVVYTTGLRSGDGQVILSP